MPSHVVVGSPDPITTEGLNAGRGDLSVGSMGRSGDRPITREAKIATLAKKVAERAKLLRTHDLLVMLREKSMFLFREIAPGRSGEEPRTNMSSPDTVWPNPVTAETLMRPDISEFSYGYVVTDELIHVHGTPITAAPVFPSLYQERQAGGGYDLQLDRPGIPLFLQFKLSHCMVRNNAAEAERGLLHVPYYRMHLRPSRHSDQHQMLLDLEAAGNEVYYCAPAFHESTELSDAYSTHQVHDRSFWLWPSCIGPLPNDEDHYCAFKNATAAYFYFCSEPRRLDAAATFDSFAKKITGTIRQKGQTALAKENLLELADTITDIGQRKRDIKRERKLAVRDEMAHRDPIERIAFYSQVYFNCQFYIAHEPAEE